MFHVLIGSLLLSIIHPAIPNHWIPLVAIGKAEKWSRKETLLVTAIVGGAHAISTIIIGIVVGLIGYKLSSTQGYISRIVAPIVLVAMGIVYVVLDLKSSHHYDHLVITEKAKRSKLTLIISLAVAMFFSPCLEIDAYYLTAGKLGWVGIIMVSIIYLVFMVLGMVLLVDLGRKGIERIKWEFLEHHDKMVTGSLLIILGVFAYFIII